MSSLLNGSLPQGVAGVPADAVDIILGDTDVVAGMEAGLRTILVLTGISTRETAERFPYRPSLIVESVADLVESVESDQFLRAPGDVRGG